jgi:hypothetical protein
MYAAGLQIVCSKFRVSLSSRGMWEERNAVWFTAQKGATGQNLERTYRQAESAGYGVDFDAALRVAAVNDHVDTLRELLHSREFTYCARGNALAAAAHHGSTAAFDLLAASRSTSDLLWAMMSAPDYEGDDAVKFHARAFPWLLKPTTAQRDIERGAKWWKLERIQADLRCRSHDMITSCDGLKQYARYMVRRAHQDCKYCARTKKNIYAVFLLRHAARVERAVARGPKGRDRQRTRARVIQVCRGLGWCPSRSRSKRPRGHPARDTAHARLYLTGTRRGARGRRTQWKPGRI